MEVQCYDKGTQEIIMCQIWRNQVLKEEMKEVALRMLAADKYALEEIVNISGLSPEEVKPPKADRSV